MKSNMKRTGSLVSTRNALCTAVLMALLASCDGSSGSGSAASTGTDGGNTGSVSGSAGSETNVEPLATNPSFSAEDIGAALSGGPVFELSVSLDGLQVVPAASTRNTGSADIVIDTTSNELYASVRSSVSDATVAHIHEGEVGEVGAIVTTLRLASDVNSQFTVDPGTQLTNEQAARLLGGQLYVDIHSSAFPDGEVRGQLSNDSVEIGLQPTLDDIQAKVFTPFCSGCHAGGGQSLPGIMNLASADASYASLVDVNSISVPELSRVASADADQSFLIHKLEGSQSAGSRMPFRGRALESETISVIRQWISNGASR